VYISAMAPVREEIRKVEEGMHRSRGRHARPPQRNGARAVLSRAA